MNYENILQEKILPELEIGRPHWDKPHTLAVVEFVKAILDHSPNLNVNRDVLIIAAYAHDWGYAGLYKNGEILNLDDVNREKEKHMEIGAQKLESLLENKAFDFLTQEEKDLAINLVRTHDKLEELNSFEELILMEADTLGGLDVRKVTPSFDKESNARYMQKVKDVRYPKFRSQYGKELFKKVYKLREEYYEKK